MFYLRLMLISAKQKTSPVVWFVFNFILFSLLKIRLFKKVSKNFVYFKKLIKIIIIKKIENIKNNDRIMTCL